MGAQTSSELIARFVTTFERERVSDDRVHAVARAFLDTFAVAIAGSHEPASQLMLEYARQQGRPGTMAGSIWACGDHVSIELAALVNGTMGHVLDYDDLTSPLRAHLSVALLPLLVALAEANNARGQTLSAAYIVGFEVACKLALPIVTEHYAKGWHSTSTIGVLAATAAGAHLLELTEQQTVHALGLAVAQASGSRENFGTMAKSFQAGHCGAAVARALALARVGFTASRTAIDGTAGFLALYAHGEDVSVSLAALGDEPLELEVCGADIKKYPMCYATHRVIDGLLDLRNRHGVTLADVAAVEIVTNRYGLKPLLHHRPQTGLEAKFSMEYAVAAALADGRVGLSSFDDEMVQRPHIQAFLPRVRGVEGPGPAMPRWAQVDVHLAEGRALSIRVEDLRGGVELPLTDVQLYDKVRDCFTFAGHPALTEEDFDAALAWSGQPVSVVVANLRRGRPFQ